MKALVLALGLAAGLNAYAEKNPALLDMQTGVSNPAPAVLSEKAYVAWANPLLDQEDGSFAYSAFTPHVFSWYEQEKGRDSLPKEVSADPEKIFVSFDKPIRETDALEASGEIEEGNTVGAELYAEMDGTVDQGLEAMKFLWGKPVGKEEGFSYPAPSPFSKRVEYFAPNADWGPGAYANLTLRRDGGIVKDLSDRYIFLVRGNSKDGYTVLMQYARPGGKTYSQACIAIAILKPMAGGKFSYRISTRYQGQNYKVLGNISIGRAQIGFNKEKVRAVAVEYRDRINELRTTGSIKNRAGSIKWGD